MAPPRSWTHQGKDGATYLCSTDPGLLDLGAFNAALGSEMLWWANALPEESLKTMIGNCLVLGLYQVDPDTQKRTMVGASKVITDHVTFGYLTDVYVLKEHQNQGLGTFMMECLNEYVQDWPEMRGFWIVSSSPDARRLYERVFGAVDFFESKKGHDLALLTKVGPRG